MTVTLAMLYGEKTETTAATQLLQGLLQGNDADQEIYVDIAQVQERGRKYTEAEQSAQKAEQMAHGDSGKETAWFLLGPFTSVRRDSIRPNNNFARCCR